MTDGEMDGICRELTTKSAKIRQLEANGVSRADIARYLQIRYQHVRNVLVAPAPANARVKYARSEESKDMALSIEDAKRGLAAQFGVSPDAIEIIIRG